MAIGYVGRDTLVEFSTQPPETTAADLVFKRLGMMRSKSMGLTWSDVDSTADTSPDYTRQYLATFKDVSFSGDYVSVADDTENQAELEDFIWNPGVATLGQPFVWFRITFGATGRVVTGSFLVTENNMESPYDDVVTGSLSAKSNGEVTSIRA